MARQGSPSIQIALKLQYSAWVENTGHEPDLERHTRDSCCPG